MTTWTDYLQRNRDRHLEQLKELLRIPSVSSSSAHREDMAAAARWVAEALRRAGLEHVRVMETGGHPVVYGDWLHAPGKPTALVYGHYDVQPPEPMDRWETPPFEPAIRDGKIYARGATDDKAQFFLHIRAVEALLAADGGLPVNLKFCIEGEEEIASPHLPAFLERNRELLAADLVVLSDGPMLGRDTPSICVGLRGLCGFELTVRGPAADLHSGLYGGGVANPIAALAELLASMRHPDGRIAVDGFYEGVGDLKKEDRERFRQIPFDEEAVRRELGVPELHGEVGFSYLERTTARPTLEINGIGGGHQGEGTKTIIPSFAFAKITCRLVDRQDPDDILDKIEAHIRKHRPPGVTVTMKRTDRGRPFVISPDHPFVRAASRAYERGFGKTPLFVRSGGSVPIVETFSRVLDAPVVMMDFGLPGENLHAPNEHFHLDQFDRGTATICHFWQQF